MSTEMVKEAMSIYDRGIEAAWDDIKHRAKTGDVQCAEILEGKAREEFVWALLQGDVIEGLGGMASATALNPSSAESELARRVSRKLGVDIEVVQQRMSGLIAKGVLRLETKGNSLRWQWSDTQKLKLASGITPATSCEA
jgi:hypothetical protein